MRFGRGFVKIHGSYAEKAYNNSDCMGIGTAQLQSTLSKPLESSFITRFIIMTLQKQKASENTKKV